MGLHLMLDESDERVAALVVYMSRSTGARTYPMQLTSPVRAPAFAFTT